MKNKFYYFAILSFTVVTMMSCASRKYGCPNTTGIKNQVSTPVHTAV